MQLGGRKGIRPVKTWGVCLSSVGVTPTWTVGASASIFFLCSTKPRRFLRRKRREEFRCMVGDKVEEVKWQGLGVNDHWQRMKNIMMETAQDICGMTKGPRRHKVVERGGCGSS